MFKLGNIYPDLGDSALSLVLSSPYPLVDTEQSGNFVFRINLPATPELKKELQYAHRPAAGGVENLPFTLRLAGRTYAGIALLQKAGSDVYEVFLPIANGDFNVISKEVSLKDLDYGEQQHADDDTLRASARTDTRIHVKMSSSEQFTETISPAFETILSNAHSEMAAASFSPGEATKFSFIFSFNVEHIITSTAILVLKKNGTNFRQSYIDKATLQKIQFDVEAVTGDVFSWEIQLQSYIYNVDYDNEEVDFAINSGELLVVKNEFTFNKTALDKQWPEVNYASFPLENTEAFSLYDEEYFSIDNTNIKNLYTNFFKVINYFTGGSFPTTLSRPLEEETVTGGNLVTVFPFLGYIFQQIAEYFSIRLVNNPFDVAFKNMVLINHFIENEFIDDESRFLKNKTGFTLRDHVPDWTVYRFINNVCNLLGCGYEWDDNLHTLTFTFIDDLLISQEYTDITAMVGETPVVEYDQKVKGVKLSHGVPQGDKLSNSVITMEGLNFRGYEYESGFLKFKPNTKVNDCFHVTESGYWIYTWLKDEGLYGWKRHGEDYVKEIQIGTEPVELKTELCPVFMRPYDVADDTMEPESNRFWRIPASHQAAQFEGAPVMYNTEWTPMVAYYFGMVTDSQGNNYPYASPIDRFDEHKGRVGRSLKLDGEYGLYEMRFKRFIEWRMQTKPVKFRINPTAEFMGTFRFNRKVMVNGVRYLVANLRCNFRGSHPAEGEITLLPE